MKVSAEEKRLWINDRRIDVADKIEKTLVVGDRILIMLSGKNLTRISHPPHNNNVLCFDAHGKELWVIDNPVPTPDEHYRGGQLDQWLYLGRGEEWGRDPQVISVQSGNWICNVNLADGSLYDCVPHR